MPKTYIHINPKKNEDGEVKRIEYISSIISPQRLWFTHDDVMVLGGGDFPNGVVLWYCFLYVN